MRNELRFKIFITLFFVLLFVFFAEIILRFKGNYLTYTEKIKNQYYCPYGKSLPYFHLHTPGAQFILDHSDFKYPYTINSLGLREVEFKKEKQPGEKRILCFGDSFTEGVGAPYDSSYVRELERQLLAISPNYKVFNCAVSGSDPFYNFVLLKEQLLNYNPDIVTLTVNTSDLTDYIFLGGLERFNQNKVVSRKKPIFEPLFHYSHLVRFITITILRYDWTLCNQNQYNELLSSAVNNYHDLFIEFNELCKAKGVDFLLLIQPHPDDIVFPEGSFKYLVNMEQNMIKDTIKNINLFPHLAAKLSSNNIDKYSWKIDGHYNSRGYKLLGEIVFTEAEKKYPGFWRN